MASTHDPNQAESQTSMAQDEVIDLTPTVESVGGESAESFHVALVDGAGPSLASATTPLLLARLRAVTILLAVVYALVLVWAFLQGRGLAIDADLYRNVSILRLGILGVVLALLYARPSYPQSTLRAIEYVVFGLLTLIWAYARFRAVHSHAIAGNQLELLVESREALFGLFILLIVHGIFIPHRWQETARVVLTMALAPVAAILLFDVCYPELTARVADLMSPEYVGTTILIVTVGAILATYGSAVLNTLRSEVHEARKYGQYQLRNRIGGGGMGEVFLAEHALMKRPCALKLIRSESAADPTALARFEREVQTTASLTHPHTIDIYDYGHTDDGTFYYVMEHLPGMSLAELIRRHGPIPPGRTIYLLRQICSALAEAHAAGLIHRDLKPGNLFVSERGGSCDFVKVLDFGLVKLTKAPEAAKLTQDHVVSGTPLYMAPEQARADQGLDGRCDLYALGAIAYHMLTGRPPFPGENPVSIIVAHATEEVTPLSTHGVEIPQELEAIVLRCLAKKPVDRFADVLVMEQALAECSAASDWDAQQAAAWWHTLITEAAK